MLILYSLSIFCGAALLFLVQPLFARLVLPMLGGSPAVWNTALVFYQTALLAGYAWTHFSIRWLGAKRQAAVHLAVLLAALFFLPIALPSGWIPPSQHAPTGWLLKLLLVAVGVPFFAVSTTSPALQRWFATTGHPAARDPYFLYAASNAGSLLALGAYPFLLEPRLRLAQQSAIWTIGFCLLILLTAGCALVLWLGTKHNAQDAVSALPPAGTRNSTVLQDEAISASRRARWVILAAVPSSLMVGVTTYLSNEIAAIPLLWIVPLTLYLLSFIIVFSRNGESAVPLVARIFAILVLPLAVALAVRAVDPMSLLVPLHLLVLFLGATMCHGALVRDRPAPAKLTEFYLLMSLGGALGGAFNALVAPQIFNAVTEYPIAIAAACLLIPATLIGAPPRDWRDEAPRDLLFGIGAALLTLALVWGVQRAGMRGGPVALALMFGPAVLLGFSWSRRPLRFALVAAGIAFAGVWFHGDQERRVLRAERSFFGVHRVTISPSGQYRQLIHGNTLHGSESTDAKRAGEPLTYYYRTGPIGQIFQTFEPQLHSVGVVGLGVGSLAAYGKSDQSWTYYEIDPVVERIAREDFTFLPTAKSHLKVVLGDARLRLKDARPGEYDLLVLDAYSSDAIPIHLLTREALKMYLDALAPHGLLAFHLSNRHLDLQPVLGKLAQDAGLVARVRSDDKISRPESLAGKTASQWMVLARRSEELGPLRADHRWTAPGVSSYPVWTDDYSSILPAMTWK